jgi:cytochrome c oxidase subunit I
VGHPEPPPRHNFVELPRIRSERPAFEMHYPHLIDRLPHEAHAGRRQEPYASELVGGTDPIPPEPARRWEARSPAA